MEQVRTDYDAGPLWAALAEAAHAVDSDASRAAGQLQALLKVAPGQPQALQLLVDLRRATGDLAGARTTLESMAAELPELAAIHFELGLLTAELGDAEAAVRSLSRVVELEPQHPQAWRALGDALAEIGNETQAAHAYARQFQSSLMDVKTLEHVSGLDADQAEIAEEVLREYLNIQATDLTALELMANMYLRLNQFESAQKVFERALELVPSFRRARAGYVAALHRQLRPEEEGQQLDILLQDDPDNPEYRVLKAATLSASGKSREAVEYCETLLGTDPENHRFWLAYAQALRVAARQNDCIAAYRKAIELEPRLGEAWWGLANLKTFRFNASDVQTMRNDLSRADLTDGNRVFLHFALGKALEDLKVYDESFQQYRSGNALVRAANPYNIEDIVDGVARERQRFPKEFFVAHADRGNPAADPIFILGLPRSGSTLVEQVLASHSLVEGAGELPCLISLVRRLESKSSHSESECDGAAALLHDEDLNALGEEYLERTRSHRKSMRPHFTDKMPSNFHHLGLICAILPNAKIIDARRHPLACCLSNFKQIFPFRQGPSYDLADIGRYYRAYVELLAHFDRVLPGRIHRVSYEELVGNPEQEIRRLLGYCDLPFEEACLRFYETERGIRTISSEQVRQPVYKDALEQWRPYEQWLGPLVKELGPVLDAYPAVPDRV
ncbi:MAG: tetratricopeptide repeat-containing sulfotransferase family protein [Alphaproteobacteria bacterium]|jgi:tetratricopeptide (TPR) repeat protein